MLSIIEMLLIGFEHKDFAYYSFTIFESIIQSISSFYSILYLCLFNINALLFTGCLPVGIQCLIFLPIFIFDKIFSTNSRHIHDYIGKSIYNFIKDNYTFIQILLKYSTILSMMLSVYLLYKYINSKIKRVKKQIKRTYGSL